MTAEPNVSVDRSGNDPLLLCPACGYDLRATNADRCSECGLAIDRVALRESGLPWAHRRKVGRVRAYVATVWHVAIDSRRLAAESARPQDARDGRAFRRATAVLVAVTLLGAWGWAVFAAKALTLIAYEPKPLWAGGGMRTSPWEADIAVPWSAGATLPGFVPVCLVLLAFYLTGVQQAVFRIGTPATVEYRRRVGAIAHYAAGPLALLLPGVACLLMAVPVGGVFRIHPLAAALEVAGGALILVALGATLARVGQWVRRVRHGGTWAAVFAAAELAGLWQLGAVLILGVVPWCVGFLWIVLDSFR